MRGSPAAELFRGRTALVTGASSGIGWAFAERAAALGSDLILVARRHEALEALAAELRGRYGAGVHVHATDLAVPGAASELVEALSDASLSVDVLVNNAGMGLHGHLAEADPERTVGQIQLNVVALADLTTRVLPHMVKARRGAIVNIASTAAFQPVPHMVVYGATKAFVLSFSRALWAETRRTGVRVLAVCPGATDTAFYQLAGDAASPNRRRRRPEQVIDTALRALDRGRPTVVDGRVNAILAAVSPRLPTRLAIATAERSVRPSSEP